MLLLTGLICCLCIYVQSQNEQYPSYPRYQDASNIYFPEAVNVLPLSTTTQNKPPSEDIVRKIFGEAPRNDNVFENSNKVSINKIPQGQNLAKQQGQNLGQAGITRPLNVQPGIRNVDRFNGLLYSVTNFGINLLKNINAIQSGNSVVSPYSITSLLALLQQGAIGQTQQEISTALRMSPAASASAYFEIANDYKQRNSPNILRTASNVFIGDSFNLNSTFKKVAQRNFDSDITPVSFRRPDEAARRINSWVASRTNNKIEKLISPDSLQESTQIVLVNAIYFKGLWDVPFKIDATKPGEFHLSNGRTKTVQFMHTQRQIKTGLDPATNAEVVLLPFERNQYSLMVILPSKAAGITGLLASLTDARLLSYLSFQEVETDLQLPKFTVRADTNLVLLLRDMGIARAFSPYAEFNGLGTYRAFPPQISSAVHSAVLSIDEQGGSAAAATSVAAVALSYEDPAVVSFKADRPFIAVLWDTESSLPLFIARIEDPQL